MEEKTGLIREIHHRVKNNLQVIASLLSIQPDQVRTAADATLFRRNAERVISMALGHEQLYQIDDFAFIPFHNYLVDLVGPHQRSDRAREDNNRGRI